MSIDEQMTTNLQNTNAAEVYLERGDKSATISSPFVTFDVAIRTQQTPGVVLFENYEQIKQNISDGVAFYSEFKYSLANYQIALKHRDELKYVKNVLEKTKREITKNYNAPMEVVEKRLEELIDLVKEPFKKVDTFIKQNEKESKKYEIYNFARDIAILNGLQEHMDNIFKSPEFFNYKWLNTSCAKTVWKSEVSAKVKTAVKDIAQILSMRSDNVASILAHYYQTLSMERVEEFISSLQVASNIARENCSTNIIAEQTCATTTVADETNIENIVENESNFMNLKDFEILNYVADSLNPYTGEVITGIEDCLKSKLKQISKKLEN